MMTTLLIIIFITFIGVGLPASVLGTAWPAIYREFNLPVSIAGYITATVSACTIISSLISSKVINRFGTGVVSAVSTLMTATALLGFALANNAVPFFLLAIPLGLGAGSIDTALNNFVALHYSASKMNFLHCFYGLGVAASPYIMSLALGAEGNWRKGYIIIGLIQFCIALIAALSLPLWKRAEKKDRDENTSLPKTLTLSQLFKMPAVRLSCLAFFGSCALELCAGSWSSTYFVNIKGLPSDKAAQIAMLFYIGLASGRFLSGIVAHKTGRWRIIRIAALILFGAIILFILPLPLPASAAALFFIGLGCGPVFPNLTHLTPQNFGADISQSVIGVQQASSYAGIMLMPWLFGILAQAISTAIFPYYLLLLFVIFALTLFMLKKAVSGKNKALSPIDYYLSD
ncbi:MAG: MFS transporter [Eubacteriales bacterium]|nr:MFS transporter [Candidatus Colimorpha enterica]